jgi:hypothetical protein
MDAAGRGNNLTLEKTTIKKPCHCERSAATSLTYMTAVHSYEIAALRSQ